MISQREVYEIYNLCLSRDPESHDRVAECVRSFSTRRELLDHVRGSVEYAAKAVDNLSESYRLTDGYQSAYTIPKLSSPHARVSEDRCKSIELHCRNELGCGSLSNLKIFDVGCSQGFNSFYFADRGAEVSGLDYNASNIIFCRKLSQFSGIKCGFEHQAFDESSIKSIIDSGANTVFFLSVLHHVILDKGLSWVSEALDALLQHNIIIFAELAQPTERVDFSWKRTLPSVDVDIFPSDTEVNKLGVFSALDGLGQRPLYAAFKRNLTYSPLAGIELPSENTSARSGGRITVELPQLKLSSVGNAVIQNKQYKMNDSVYAKIRLFDVHSRIDALRVVTSEIATAKILSEIGVAPQILGLSYAANSYTVIYLRIRGGNLSQFATVSTLDERRSMALSIATKIRSMHNKGIYWNDCREHNIVIDENGEPYFTDFEFSGYFEIESDVKRARWMLWHLYNGKNFANTMKEFGNYITAELPEIFEEPDDPKWLLIVSMLGK